MQLDAMQPMSPSLVQDTLGEYVQLSMAENTRLAYKNDLAHFIAWGGSIPASPKMVAAYLAVNAESMSVATLARRLAAIAKMHSMQGLPSPSTSDLVKMAMRGIRRKHGKPQRQAAPLLRDDLLLVLSVIPDDMRGCRDKALLLIGFCAALRRSELCRVRVEDLTFTSEGMVLTLPRSKTDQMGEGRKIGIPSGRGKICPVRVLQEWLTRSDITSGFVFRPIDGGKVTDTHLCNRTISNIVKARVEKVGLLPENFSGHSLRSGLATSAAQHGISSFKIREQTGHRSDAMLARYIRDGNLFAGNAAALF